MWHAGTSLSKGIQTQDSVKSSVVQGKLALALGVVLDYQREFPWCVKSKLLSLAYKDQPPPLALPC